MAGDFLYQHMPRQDIIMDAEYGEVETSGQIAGKTFYDFHLFDSVEGADNAACRYGEIAVPVDFLASYSDARGIHIRIPYVADIRLLKVRIAMKSGSGGSDMYVVQLTAGIGFPS